MNANEIVQADLNYIINNAREEFNHLSGHRLLITGGAGFIGYYFVKAIVEWNLLAFKENSKTIDLLVYDNFQRGIPNWLNELALKNLITVKNHDISNPLPSDLGDVDFIVHAASIATPVYYRKNPIETMDANVYGLRHLLNYQKKRLAKKKYVGGLLYFSTSEIYGNPDSNNVPTSEDYRGNVSCTGPRACYDESKRFGETLCVNFSKQYDLPIKIVRPFNNYGPGLRLTDGRALADFCQNVLRNEDIVILSDGTPTRTFCYISDAIVGYMKVLINGRNGESYNIGTETPEISIKKFAEMVISISKDLFNYEGKLVFSKSNDEEYLTDNPNRRCPILKKAKIDLGYEPSINLDEGLRRFLVWIKENPEQYSP